MSLRSDHAPRFLQRQDGQTLTTVASPFKILQPLLMPIKLDRYVADVTLPFSAMEIGIGSRHYFSRH
jgi:hypothetical protein